MRNKRIKRRRLMKWSACKKFARDINFYAYLGEFSTRLTEDHLMLLSLKGDQVRWYCLRLLAFVNCWKISWSETTAVIAAVVSSQLAGVCVNQLTAREGSDVTVAPPPNSMHPCIPDYSGGGGGGGGRALATNHPLPPPQYLLTYSS